MAKPKIDAMIRALYKERPTIVDDDAKLVAAIWHNLGWDYTATLYENLRVMPQADTITRARRKLHEQGEIRYSEDVDAKRFKKFTEITDEYGHSKGNFIMTDRTVQPRADTIK